MPRRQASPQDRVEPVRAPGAEHAHDVAAADVDQVLREQVRGEVVLDAAGALVAPEQRDVARLAVGGEAPVEAHDVVVGVAGGGRQEAHARARRRRRARARSRRAASRPSPSRSHRHRVRRSGEVWLPSARTPAGGCTAASLLQPARGARAEAMDRRPRFPSRRSTRGPCRSGAVPRVSGMPQPARSRLARPRVQTAPPSRCTASSSATARSSP